MTDSELRMSAVMPAPPEAVHAALTDAAALRVWLAEHAEVALPDRYEFWGRYTPDGAEPHQRVLHADERSLRFAWTVDGVETTVGITLTDHGPDHGPDNDHEPGHGPDNGPEPGHGPDDAAGGTLLTLTQSDLPSFAEILSDTAGPRGELQTFWTLSISNLFDHLSGRELTPRCDYTSPELRGSVVIDAAPDAVFDSLTQSEHLDRWMGAKVDVEPRVGGRFAMGGFDVDPGGIKFSEFEPGRKATLRFADGLTSSWELDGSEGRTRLTFVQSGFDVGNPPYPGWAGWLAGVADLRRYHELPRWRTLLRRIEAPGVPDEMFSIDA
jgi:uncharacterized protein YndB with AHSA1/START domain